MLQTRQLWMFAALCRDLEPRQDWLDVARHGADFLTRHGRDGEGNWYYALTRDGQPLMEPFSIFSDCFAAMGFSAYAQASGDDEAKQIAAASYENFLARRGSPKGQYSKQVPGVRPMLALSLRMIHLNMLLELEWQLPAAEVRSVRQTCLQEVFELFLDADRQVLFENVAPDGSHPDTQPGRMINPGHGVEVLWMAMANARRLGESSLVERAARAIVATMEYGWDEEYGGLIYRRDALGKPLYQIEWDQKMSWAHAEAMIALAMAWKLTGRQDCLDWLERLDAYIRAHYVDAEYGEWYGHLNRRGEVLLSAKGGRWKGCFHVPRALLLASRYLLDEREYRKETQV